MTFHLQRYEKNPVLTPRDNDWERLQVRNPAACYDGRKVHLVYSARAVTNTIHLGLAESDNGYDFRRVGEGPWVSPAAEGFDAGTIEDARMVNNVVFPNGAVVLGDTLFVYYGGADTVCCVATAPLRDVLDHVLAFRR